MSAPGENAPFCWLRTVVTLHVPPHFFVRAQRNGVEPQRNALLAGTLQSPSKLYVRTRAQSARLKVSPAFSKAAGSRDRVPGRAPQSAKPPVLKEAQEGVQGGTLAGGSPFYFSLVRVRLYVCRLTLRPAARHPISFALAKRNGVSPKEKRPLVLVFMIADRTLRRQCLCAGSADPGEHVRPRRRWGWRSSGSQRTRCPSPGANVPTRRAGQPLTCGETQRTSRVRYSLAPKGAFLWRLDTVSLGKDQRNGVEKALRGRNNEKHKGAHAQTQEGEFRALRRGRLV